MKNDWKRKFGLVTLTTAYLFCLVNWPYEVAISNLDLVDKLCISGVLIVISLKHLKDTAANYLSGKKLLG